MVLFVCAIVAILVLLFISLGRKKMSLKKCSLYGVWGRDGVVTFGERDGSRQIMSLTDGNFNFYKLDPKNPHNGGAYGYIIVDAKDINYQHASNFALLMTERLIVKPTNVFYVHRRYTGRHWWRSEWVLEQQFVPRDEPNKSSFVTWLGNI